MPHFQKAGHIFELAYKARPLGELPTLSGERVLSIIILSIIFFFAILIFAILYEHISPSYSVENDSVIVCEEIYEIHSEERIAAYE